MEKITCSQLRLKLAEIKDLKNEFNLAMRKIRETKDTQNPKSIVDGIYGLIEGVDEVFGEHHLLLRKMYARRWNADFIGDFHDGLALVERGDDRFFIDKYGKNPFGETIFGEVAEFGFKDGIAAIDRSRIHYADELSYEYINNKGENIFGGKKFAHAGQFHDGVAIAALNHDGYFFIDKSGERLAGLSDETLFSSGKMSSFKDGFAKVHEVTKKGPIKIACYFLDSSGNKCFNKDFITASEFRNGFAIVRDASGSYVIDASGQDILQGKRYEYIEDYHDGMIAIKDSRDRLYFCDTNGRELFNGKKFLGLEHFSEGCAVAAEEVKEGEKMVFKRYFLNIRGENEFPEKEFANIKSFKKGHAWVSDESGWFMIDRSGEDIFHGKRFGSGSVFEIEGVIKCFFEKGVTYLDMQGNEIFKK